MSRIFATVALLLITGLANEAAAQDGLNDPSGNKKAEKINAYLDSIGITNPRIQKFTSTINERMEGKNIRLAEEHFESGRLVLHYQARPKISIRQMELKFQPVSTPNTEYTATKRSLMMKYKYSF